MPRASRTLRKRGCPIPSASLGTGCLRRAQFCFFALGAGGPPFLDLKNSFVSIPHNTKGDPSFAVFAKGGIRGSIPVTPDSGSASLRGCPGQLAILSWFAVQAFKTGRRASMDEAEAGESARGVESHPRIVPGFCRFLKRGLVASPELWRWSSYRDYWRGVTGRVKIGN